MNTNAYGKSARYPAHCAHCVLIGTDGPFDLFRCRGSLITGLVWRYGDGPAYTTIPEALDEIRAELAHRQLDRDGANQ